MALPIAVSLFLMLLGLGSSLLIKRIVLTQPVQTATLAFDAPFAALPQFAYVIQGLDIHHTAFRVEYAVTAASTAGTTVQFTTAVSPGAFNTHNKINLVLLFSSSEYAEIATVAASSLSASFTYRRPHPYPAPDSYSLQIFGLTMPCRYNIVSVSSEGFMLSFLIDPGMPIVISYILHERLFLARNVLSIVDQFNQVTPLLNLIIREGYLTASDENVFLGMRQLVYSGASIRLVRTATYGLVDAGTGRPKIIIGYTSITAGLTRLRSATFLFNTSYSQCQSDGYFLSYSIPFSSLPVACKPCSSQCRTCLSSEADPQESDPNFCVSCPVGRYFEPAPNSRYGQCLCLRGSITKADGSCAECESFCLLFSVVLMKSSAKTEFMLIFSEANANLAIPFNDNLYITVNGVNATEYQTSLHSQGVYLMTLTKQDMKACETYCNVTFIFRQPDKITFRDKYLSKQEEVVGVQNFHIVDDRLPESVNRAFMVVGLIVAGIASVGQTSLVRMLFELEQIIEVHKYLDLEIPVVFKQFLEAMSSFRFMDFTTAIDFDIGGQLRQLSPGFLDAKGSPKLVYYESGTNFYKNMVGPILTCLVILLTNLAVYALLRVLPFNFTTRLSEKLKIRWVITFSDIIETLVIPLSLFAMFQLMYAVYAAKLVWIYALASVFSFCLLAFPLLVVVYSSKRRASQVEEHILEDLLLDCKISHSFCAHVFYACSFGKKFMFGVVLGMPLRGSLQLYLLLGLNGAHLLLIVYLMWRSIPNSRVKIATRTINLLCVICLEMLILLYNTLDRQVDRMILIGVTCTYLAIVVTVIGMAELVIKLVEIVFQRISAEEKPQHPQFVTFINDRVLKCNIANVPVILNFGDNSSEQSSNNIKEDQYQEDNTIGNTTKYEGMKANRFRAGNHEQESASDNSEIVPIDSRDSLMDTIIWSEASNQGEPGRKTPAPAKLTQKAQQAPSTYSSRARRRRESQDASSLLKNQLQTIDQQIKQRQASINRSLYRRRPDKNQARLQLNAVQAVPARTNSQSSLDRL